jgi:hypothetical protein
MLVSFERVTEGHIAHVSDNLREGDRVELRAGGVASILNALQKSVNQSQYCSTALLDGTPCAIFGLVKTDILSGIGIPWLLGTDLIDKGRRHFIVETKRGVDEMLTICPTLINVVHVENKKTIRWLKSMGFKFGKPAPIGVRGEMFMQFTMVK